MVLGIRRRALLVQVAGYVTSFALGWAAFAVHTRFIVLAVLALASAWFWVRKQQCPTCGKPLYRRDRSLFGTKWSYYSPTPPSRYCTRCKTDLNIAGSSNAPVKAGSRLRREPSTSRASQSITLAGRIGVRKIVVILVAAILANFSGLLYVWIRPSGQGPGTLWISMAMAVMTASAAGLWLVRCADCKHRLGRGVFDDHCPHCARDLRVRSAGGNSVHS